MTAGLAKALIFNGKNALDRMSQFMEKNVLDIGRTFFLGAKEEPKTSCLREKHSVKEVHHKWVFSRQERGAISKKSVVLLSYNDGFNLSSIRPSVPAYIHQTQNKWRFVNTSIEPCVKTSAYASYFFMYICSSLLALYFFSNTTLAEGVENKSSKSKTNPLDSDYLTNFPDSPQMQEIRKLIEERAGALKIDSGISIKDLEFLAKWLESHHHGFMHMTVDKNVDLQFEPYIARINSVLEANRKSFRDRASDYECAYFATLAYENARSVPEDKFPAGWEILKFDGQLSHRQDSNGYYGLAFVNHLTGNVIIAHRGTEFSDNNLTLNSLIELYKDLKTDFEEVGCQQLGPQQRSAVEFSRSVHDVLQSKKCRYRIGCVGHSLGGWLAQLTAADLQREGGHALCYAVCLDSPGAKEMLDGYYKKRYGTDPVGEIDVTNYVLLPNFVNTFGTHAGTVYQVFSDQLIFQKTSRFFWPFPSTSDKMLLAYLLKTHSKATILAAFDKNQGVALEKLCITEWPTIDWGRLLDSSQVNHITTFQKMLELYCAGPVAKVFEALRITQSLDQATQKYRNFFQSVNSEDFNALKNMAASPDKIPFRVRYESSYKPEIFNPQEINIENISTDARGFIVHICKLAKVEDKPLVLFLEDFVRKLDIDKEKEIKEALLSLSSLQVRGKKLCTSHTQLSATEIRKNAEMLIKCFPNIAKKMNISEYLFFCNQRYPRFRTSYSEDSAQLVYSNGAELRDDVNQEIDKKFMARAIVYLYGPVGSGKSEIAAHWLRKQKEKDASVFFFDASDLEALKKDWLDFAVSYLKIDYDIRSPLSNEQVIKRSYEALNRLDSCSLVFNNASNVTNINGFIIEENFKGKILITTSSSKIMTPNAQKNYIDLTEYPLQEAKIKKMMTDLDNNIINELLDSLNFKYVLAKFPIIAKLTAAFLKNSGKTRDFLNWIKENDNSGQLFANEAINKIKDEIEKQEPFTKAIFQITPFLSSRAIHQQLLEEWLFSPEAKLFFDKRPDKSEVARCINYLENCGILQKKDKADSVFAIHPMVYHQLKNESKAHFNSATLYSFLSFLSNKITMNNISLSDFKEHKKLRHQVDHLFKLLSSQPQKKEQFLPLLIELLSAGANNYLQDELYIQSKDAFFQIKTELEKACDINYSLGDFGEPDDIELVFHKLNLKDERFPDQFATALHYLGRIEFQMGKKDASRRFFEVALEIKAKALENKKKDTDLGQRIFKRQGEGWLLLESDHVSDWKKAKKLYIALYDQDAHYLNQYYCSLQIARIYHRLANKSSGSVKGHYYKKAVARLRDGGQEKGVPFRGALDIVSDKKSKDAETEILLELANVLGDKENPFHDFQQAEEILFKIFKLGEEKDHKSNGRIRGDTIFRVYYSLACLYNQQINEDIYSVDLCKPENKEFFAKAQGSAHQAIARLRELPFESFQIVSQKRKKEIEDLEKILSASSE